MHHESSRSLTLLSFAPALQPLIPLPDGLGVSLSASTRQHAGGRTLIDRKIISHTGASPLRCMLQMGAIR